MHSKKPVYALLAAGIAVVAVLTFFPYTLTLAERAGRDAVNTVREKWQGASGAPLAAEMRPTPLPAPPQHDAALWYGSRGQEPEKHGVLVQTFDGRQVLAAHNADTTFNPASLVKLATTLVALRKLGPGHRFTTRVYAEGSVDPKTKQLQGSLYLAGDDPTFGDYGAHVVARELKARGIERVRDKIHATYGFSFNFHEKSEDSAKHTADVLKLGQKETGSSERPAGAELFVIHSNPLSEILLYMNAHSVNFVADRIGGMCGGPAEVARFLVEELKLPAEGVYLETCSGLYTNRMTPRGVAAVIRALAAEANRLGLKVEDLMPVATCDWGTLRRRLEGTPFECAAVGKTGTLTTTDGGMSNLAGIAFTQDSGPVLFVVLAQGNRIWENKQMTDELLTELLARNTPAPVMQPSPQARRHLLPSANLRVEPQMYTGTAAKEIEERVAKSRETESEDEDEPKERKSARGADAKKGAGAKGKAATNRKPEPEKKTAATRSKTAAQRKTARRGR
ncbi:MAG: D-alanyl-D-alanine carboxypeptidase [Acidobacteria bacterium]|nr:D-alanyl-D-alanine carboxypeptidase [Acidobacteriota bacterium]